MYGDELRSRDYYEGRARWYDWGNRVAALLRGASDTRERLKAIDRLNLKPGRRVLEVSVGTGTNLPLMARYVGPAGQLMVTSHAMLTCAAEAEAAHAGVDLVEARLRICLSLTMFDAVLQHIAEFGDKKGAIQEMMRVARPSAKIVVCDQGLPRDRRLPLISRLLVRLSPPAYAQEPPLQLIPPQARDVQITWFRGDAWYLIDFTNP
jgi:ubiquinone/menaquinone biosynthesis C-methylase UbiE